jgi:hypothetical protein
VLTLAAAAALAAAPAVYRDPLGLFALPLPAGWTAKTGAMNNVILSSPGHAYAVVDFLGGAGADPSMVARFKGYFWKNWQGKYRFLRTGASRLAETTGTSEVYSGTDPDLKVDATVRIVTAQAGTAAIVLLMGCPTAEWDRWKADFGAMEHGLRFVIAGKNSAFTPLPASAPSAPAAPPSAPANRGVPNGFRIAGRSGASGQALTATFSGGNSARAVFQSAFRLAGGYFDRAPELASAVMDPRDQVVEGVFRGSWQGAPVSGLMVASVDGHAGYVGLVFDRPEQFSRSLPVLSRQMSAALPAHAQSNGGQAAAAAHPHPAQPLTQTTLLDGSGSVGLPSGWRLTGSYQGCLDANGPDGSIVSLGGSMIAFIHPLPGTQANAITGPYRDPVRALPAIWDYSIMQGALRSGQATIQIIESAPVAAQQGQAAYISFRVYNRQTDGRYLALVQTAPVDDVEWMAYMSVVGAPTNRFAEMLPTLWAIWKSWSVNPAVFKARMDAALQSMHETVAIMQGIDREKQRATEIGNLGWDQVIREITTIQTLPDGGIGDIDNRTLDRLREWGLQEDRDYRVVPPSELVGPG